METVMTRSEKISLPKEVAEKFRGKRIKIIETREGVLLKPVESSIKKARGFLKGTGFTTKEYLRQKQADKEIEA